MFKTSYTATIVIVGISTMLMPRELGFAPKQDGAYRDAHKFTAETAAYRTKRGPHVARERLLRGFSETSSWEFWTLFGLAPAFWIGNRFGRNNERLQCK